MKIIKLLPVIIILLICIIVFTDIYENFVGCYSIHTGKKINVDKDCESDYCYCLNGTASDDSMCNGGTREHCNSCKDRYIHIDNRCLSVLNYSDYQVDIQITGDFGAAWRTGAEWREQAQTAFNNIDGGIKYIWGYDPYLIITLTGNVLAWGNYDSYSRNVGLPQHASNGSNYISIPIKVNISDVMKTIHDTSLKYVLYIKNNGDVFVSGEEIPEVLYKKLFNTELGRESKIWEPKKTIITNIKDIVILNMVQCIIFLKLDGQVELFIFEHYKVLEEERTDDIYNIDLTSFNNIEKIVGNEYYCFFLNNIGNVYSIVIFRLDNGYRLNQYLDYYHKTAGDFSSTTTTPQQIQGLSNIKDIKINDYYNGYTALFLTNSGNVYMCGSNTESDSWRSPLYFTSWAKKIFPPKQIKETDSHLLKDVKEITFDNNHALFLKINGDVYAFGNNSSKQICPNKSDSYYYNLPHVKKVENRENIHKVIALNNSTFYIKYIV